MREVRSTERAKVSKVKDILEKPVIRRHIKQMTKNAKFHLQNGQLQIQQHRSRPSFKNVIFFVTLDPTYNQH
jgi:hypothetical protein